METVLVIEDDPAMQRDLKDDFEQQGYTVLTGGILNEKYPGHTVIQKGKSKHFMVQDFENSLVALGKIKI